MSDSIRELAEELNKQDPVDIENLAEAFDTVFYKPPEGERPVEAEHVDGFTISSPENVEDLVQKLRKAEETNPEFIQIGDREYMFKSRDSLSRLIDGIKIGQAFK